MIKKSLVFTVLLTLCCFIGKAQHHEPGHHPANHQPERTPDKVFFGTEWKPGTLVLQSQDNRYSLDFQKDGNLVLYKGDHPVWDTKTFDKRPKNLVFQKDGNLVIYDFHDRPIWASDSNNRHGDCLSLNNDGNLVITSHDGHPVWDTNSNDKPAPKPGPRPGPRP